MTVSGTTTTNSQGPTRGRLHSQYSPSSSAITAAPTAPMSNKASKVR